MTKKALLPIVLTVFLWFPAAAQERAGVQSPYFPAADSWEQRAPADVGIDAAKLQQAIAFALANESDAPRDQELGQAQTFGREPFGEAVGPFKTRGDPAGVIIKDGYLLAEWGDPLRPDMTHSVTKSFLTATAGLAFDRGLIKDLDAAVYKQMAPVLPYAPQKRLGDADRLGQSKFLTLFESGHNRKISWDDLLRQTSDWQGTLWGKPDWADRPDRDQSTWLTRERSEPGTTWEYNDVRVNLLALCLTNIWRRPLPAILKENIMEPIGASPVWRWHGYENSFVVLDGRIIQSVSGGGHWGGGMFIPARDLARFGLLIARRGRWQSRQLLSEEFLRRAETPTRARPTYGYMNFFLNTDKKMYPSAPEGTIAFLGNGTNMVYIDRRNDLVIVVRWIANDRIDGFLERIYAGLKTGGS